MRDATPQKLPDDNSGFAFETNLLSQRLTRRNRTSHVTSVHRWVLPMAQPHTLLRGAFCRMESGRPKLAASSCSVVLAAVSFALSRIASRAGWIAADSKES